MAQLSSVDAHGVVGFNFQDVLLAHGFLTIEHAFGVGRTVLFLQSFTSQVLQLVREWVVASST